VNVSPTATQTPDSAPARTQPDILVKAENLRKVYPGGHVAVDGISFGLHRGESFGILGPNGAGKSSTMRMIGCVSRPSGGSLRVLGLDTASDGERIRARIGSVPQDDALDTELTVLENLLVYGHYFGLRRATVRERAKRLLEFAQLADRADKPVQTLSGGMRRRLTIARALINEPEIVLLDEPTTGLDPQARHQLWERLYELKADGTTLILTTHYMDEAEQLCDRLVVMDGGRFVAEGTPRELIETHVTREVLELRFVPGQQPAAAEKLGSAAQRIEALADRLLLYCEDGEAALAAVHAQGLAPVTALVRRAGLEDVFLTLTGRSLID
jgi:lipooligosaccharide transport system ATP-binding protein